jgi:hypothetical protein
MLDGVWIVKGRAGEHESRLDWIVGVLDCDEQQARQFVDRASEEARAAHAAWNAWENDGGDAATQGLPPEIERLIRHDPQLLDSADEWGAPRLTRSMTAAPVYDLERVPIVGLQGL